MKAEKFWIDIDFSTKAARVPGGALYKAQDHNSVALAFVPMTPEVQNSYFKQLREEAEKNK